MKKETPWALILGPVFAVLTYVLLSQTNLEYPIRALSAIAVQTLIWWFFEAMNPAVAGLVFACLASLLGIASTEKVFAPFANPVIFFFLGGFFVAQALEVHNVAEKILYWLDRAPFIYGHPYRISAVMILLTAILSAFLNNTATAALVLPFAVSLSKKSFSNDRKATINLILGVAYAASLGGMLTVFGTAPNLIALGMLKNNSSESISFLEWMKYAVPVGLPLILLLCGRALWIGRNFKRIDTRFDKMLKSPRFSQGASRSLVILLLSMFLLVSVSLVPSFSFFGETNAILIPALLLFFIPSGSRPENLLTWKEAKEIDWGCLLLFGAGLSMGGLVFSTGLAKIIGDSLKVFGNHPQLFLIALVVLVLVITEFASNTASVTLLTPLALAISKEAGLPMTASVHIVAITASLGLMLPVGTPPNALAFGTGLVSTKEMIRNGLIYDVIGAVLCILVFWFRFA